METEYKNAKKKTRFKILRSYTMSQENVEHLNTIQNASELINRLLEAYFDKITEKKEETNSEDLIKLKLEVEKREAEILKIKDEQELMERFNCDKETIEWLRRLKNATAPLFSHYKHMKGIKTSLMEMAQVWNYLHKGEIRA